MGLAKMFGWDGVHDFIDPRRNMLLGASAGFLSGDLGNVPRYAMEGKQADDAYAQAEAEKAERANRIKTAAAAARASGAEQLAAMIEGSGDIGTGVSMFNALDQGSSNTFADNAAARQQLAAENGLTGDDATRYILTGELPGSNQSTRAGLGQPITVKNAQTGEVRSAMPMSDGTYWDPFKQEAFGPEWTYDPAWVAAQRAQGTTLGKEVAGAQFDLPQAELTMQQTISALADIKAQDAGKKEQFGNIMGLPQQMTPAWPGSAKAKFQVAVERATNRAFLEARQMLKGGGQITDFESRKAEAAITSMQLAMEKGDEAQFDKAVADFEQAVQDGFAKLQMQAASLPSVGGAPAGGDWTVVGVE